jgi:glycosyltransferase involved in cell wall biosynthesis
MTAIPEISFCLPTFNSAARIERCLRGVLAQRAPGREILLVDNASTDDTVAKARVLLANVPHVRIVVNDKNIGRIENWNKCLELAAGRYVKFALANDVLLPGGADMLLQAARLHPGTAMVCSKQLDVQGVPEAPEPAPANPPAQSLSPGETLLQFGKNGNDTGGLGGMLIDGERVRARALRFRTDIPYWADFYFAIELASCGHTVYVSAASYLFDKSIKSRFALSGTGAHTRSLCFEARECSLLLARRLPEYGIDPRRGFEFLHTIYVGGSWFGSLPPLSRRDTRALFADAGAYQAQALRYRFWKSFGRWEHPLQRVLSIVGLYHYPWEK